MRRGQRRFILDQRERIDDIELGIRLTIKSMLLELQTSMPVSIVAVTDGGMTVTAQPLIRALLPVSIPPSILATITGVIQDAQGNNWVALPLLIHCPIVFQGGGEYILTFPIKVGNEGLAVFSSRAIDHWWTAGGLQNPVELRAHSLDDGFVFVGPRSMANAVSGINPNGPELRTLDGTTSIGIDNSTPPGRVIITAPGGVFVNGTPLIVP